jgi:4-amino-4-deoxy-L-arabinose transferase-like glycosyltransferase
VKRRCHLFRSLRFVLPALLAADVVILFTGVSWLRLIAGLSLLFLLPGLTWLQALHWLGSRRVVERVFLVGGLSTAISSLALLGAVYWPAPLDLTQILVVLNVAVLSGAAARIVGGRKRAHPTKEQGERQAWPTLRILLLLLLIMVVAMFLRGFALGYGEFHEDELENMRLAVRAMKGEEYAPFLDSKGPIHWLLPAALWFMHGWLSEALARAVFVICSGLTVIGVYALGRRLLGQTVGLLAAAFMAVNGLLVAYARHVEAPSIIVLWGVLAAWCGIRIYVQRRSAGARTRDLELVAWFLLGIGVIAHPNMILYLPPFVLTLAYAYNRAGKDRWTFWRQQRPAFIIGGGIFLALAAIFYVPFVLDPNFNHAVEYFAGERVGTQFLYNSVAGLISLEADYSTRYFLPLILLFTAALLWYEARKYGWRGQVAFALIAAALASTVLTPHIWLWGEVNAAIVPYAILIIGLALSNKTGFAVKALGLWFGVPYLALAFLAQDAATHVRNAYPALFLLAAGGLFVVWQSIPRQWGKFIKPVLGAVLAAGLALVITYEYLQFLGPVTAYWRAEADSKTNPSSVYLSLFGPLPRPRKLVSNPRLGGWKVVGALVDSGELTGDFRSIQESFAVPIWYTHQMPRSCFEDPQNYFVRIDARGIPEEVTMLQQNGYGLTRVVLVDQAPKLLLFEKGVPDAEPPQTYDVDHYRSMFDRTATPERYIIGQAPQHPLQVTFGGMLRLQGYDLPQRQINAGETLSLSLYWQGLSEMDVRYRVFVHVEGEQMYGQHDDDPVCRLRTDEWRPPQSGKGQFRLTIAPETPTGVYPITVGVYNPETGERLDAVDISGRSLGSVLELTTVQVQR